MPKDRAEVEAGTVFYDWLTQESFHRDIRINVNGKSCSLKKSWALFFRKMTGLSFLTSLKAVV
jgi:hypothetical protein